MDSEPHTPPSERFDWFEQLDELLREEDIVLEALKHGVNAGNLTQDDMDNYLYEYIRHRFEKPM